MLPMQVVPVRFLVGELRKKNVNGVSVVSITKIKNGWTHETEGGTVESFPHLHSSLEVRPLPSIPLPRR